MRPPLDSVHHSVSKGYCEVLSVLIYIKIFEEDPYSGSTRLLVVGKVMFSPSSGGMPLTLVLAVEKFLNEWSLGNPGGHNLI